MRILRPVTRRYTDAQMQRVLAAHADGALRRHGDNWLPWSPCDQFSYERGCANQFAYNEPDTVAAADKNPPIADNFDSFYISTLTPEELILLLDGRELPAVYTRMA